MAQNRNPIPAECYAVQRSIEYLTENEFSIIRLSGLNGIPEASGEYDFLVRDPHGYELEIKVEIDPSIVWEVTRRSRGRILRQSAYWLCCAERHLATYLWENEDYPPDARLRVDQLTLEDLDHARRWED